MAALIDHELIVRGDLSAESGFPATQRSEPNHSAASDRACFVTQPRRNPSVRILLCPGPRFDRSTAEGFVRTAAVVCRTNRHVVLDLRDVAAVDVAGLLAIGSLVRVSRAAGGVLRLCNASRPVRRLLAATGVHQLADVYHTREPAVWIDPD